MPTGTHTKKKKKRKKKKKEEEEERGGRASKETKRVKALATEDPAPTSLYDLHTHAYISHTKQ